ncbi:MAG TPA: glycosyltransferase family 2 protein [Candidatus Dormibacteraeota bacterium]|nr:glycosyltransferase family 2 protein [Candidatus Dormibacteraeota bacterium]
MTEKRLVNKSVPKVAVIIVSYGHDSILRQLLTDIGAQKKNYDKLVVVDNHPNRKGALVARETGLVDIVIETQNNGFSAGCNIGVKAIEDEVDILFFLNPDTLPGTNVLDVIRRKQGNYALTMPLLTLPSGKVNSAGNVVHISGLSWCAGLEDDQSSHTKETKLCVASGACLAVSVEWWRKLGGMEENYFMYYEDTDFSTRALLLGADIGLLPEARVEHYYEYHKGQYKWFYLERNRLIYIIRCWPGKVIAVLLPLLFVVEISLWFVAIIQKRFILKLKATISMIKALPFAFHSRLSIQSTRLIGANEFYKTLVSRLDSPALGLIGNNSAINNLLSAYYKGAGALLKWL